MAAITWSTFQIPNWKHGGSTAKLRLYCLRDFTDSLGVPYLHGSPGSSTGFFQEIVCTIAGSTITVPSFVTTSTQDALLVEDRTVLITGVLFDSKGARRETLFKDWVIPSTTPTTWAALRALNSRKTLPNPASRYLDEDAIQALIAASVGSLNDASDVVKGRTKLSVAPAVPANPIAIGEGDPRIANSVLTTGSYANPAWITSLAGSKITGTVPAATTATSADNAEVVTETIGTGGTVNIVGDLSTDTVTGTKFGTSPTQKQSFWNAAPVVQPAVPSQTSGAAIAQLETEINSVKQLLVNLGLAAFPVSPSSIAAANLKAFLKPESLGADTTAISSWADSSGTNNHLVQATGADQPVVDAGELNSYKAAAFDGTSDYMTFTTPIVAPRTFFFVVKHNTGSQNLAPVLATTGVGAGEWNGGSDSDYFGAYYSGYSIGVPSSGHNTRLLSNLNFNSTLYSGSAYVNGAFIQPLWMDKSTGYQAYILVSAAASATVSGIGSPTAPYFWNGKVVEVAIWNAVLTSTQLSQLISYANNKFALAAPTFKPVLVTEGDSIMQGYGVTDVIDPVEAGESPKSMGAIALAAAGLKTIDFASFAFPSRTLTSMINDAATTVDLLYNANRSKNIFISNGGTNDFGAGVSLATVQSRYQTLMLARRAVGFKNIACTLLPRADAQTPVGFEANRLAFNVWLRANYTTFADVLMDIGGDATMGCTGCASNVTYYPDLLHPGNAGHVILGTYFVTALNAALALP